MKDGFRLIATAAIFGVVAWSFWHFLGSDGFGALSTIALLFLVVDNIRLRRKLKSEQRR